MLGRMDADESLEGRSGEAKTERVPLWTGHRKMHLDKVGEKGRRTEGHNAMERTTNVPSIRI